MSLNTATICTSTVLALGTIGAVVGAATATASTVALVAYTILAIALGSTAIASITARFDRNVTDVGSYFRKIPEHMGYAMAAAFQLVAQTLLMSLVQGIANGISRAVSRRIAGDDVTITHRHV